MSAIPKLFEQLVCGTLESAVGHLIHLAQHGFCSGRSTTTNLVDFVDNVLEEMSVFGQVDAVYTDFALDLDSLVLAALS